MGIKISQFPAASAPNDSDVLAGVQNGTNKKFSFSLILAWVKNHITASDIGAVPDTRTINGQGLTADITLTASDIGAVDSTDVGVADGVASLDSNGILNSSQAPPASDTDYDNTTSGLASTKVQGAIDEVYGAIPADASDVDYDNATSGLSAANVQSAVDEVASDVADKQATITASGILKGDGAGSVSAAVAGTDYQAPLTAGTDYAIPSQLADKANQAQLAYVETGTTASRAYSAGEYFCWNGLLYRVTTAISNGDTITPGTNCEAGTIGNLIKSFVSIWNPTNGSAVSGRCVYSISGGTLIVYFGMTLSSTLANHSEVEVMDISNIVGRSVPSNLPIGSTTGMAYQQNQNDVFVRLQYNSGKLYIRNDSGASISTSRIIYGQIVLPIL